MTTLFQYLSLGRKLVLIHKLGSHYQNRGSRKKKTNNESTYNINDSNYINYIDNDNDGMNNNNNNYNNSGKQCGLVLAPPLEVSFYIGASQARSTQTHLNKYQYTLLIVEPKRGDTG